MPDAISRYTPRQIADAIVCAVLDAVQEYKDAPMGLRVVKRGDAVLDTLKELGVVFANEESTDA